jgi:hypothetical protein
MTRAGCWSLVLLLGCPLGCAARSGAARSSFAHAPLGSAPPAEPLEVWGRDNAPSGLARADVAAFVLPREPELRKECWDRRFDRWEHAEAEYGLAVDPSGEVFPTENAALLSGPTAELTRGGEKQSSPELAGCIERHVDNWLFPRAIMPTFVLLRFTFDQSLAEQGR